MSRLIDLKNGDWSSEEFWSSVDDLTDKQKQKLYESVGGFLKVKTKHRLKVTSASQRELNVKITVLDYAALLYAASITVDSIGYSGYHLSRVNDKGSYRRRHCRFLWFKENHLEKNISEKQRSVSRTNVENRRLLKTKDPEAFAALYKNVGSNMKIVAYNNDQQLLSKLDKLSAQELKKIGYPSRGWISNLSDTLGIPRGRVHPFLNRNHDAIKTLERRR